MLGYIKLASLTVAIIVVLNIRSPAVTALSVDSLISAVSSASKLGKMVREVIREWTGDSEESSKGLELPFLSGSKVLSKLERVYAKLDGLEANVQNQASLLMYTFQTNLPKDVRNELRISKLMEILNEIDRKDNLLKVYKKLLESKKEANRLWYFTSSIISHEYNSVLSLWDRLHSTFLAPEYKGPIVLGQTSILHQMADTVKIHGESLCHVQQSPMQMLHSMHNTLQLSQLKAYSLMQFAWRYRTSVNESYEYEEESKHITDLYLSRMAKQTEMARNALRNVSQALWRCDPSQHVLNETFTRVTHFLQGYLVNEVDMNSGSGCWKNCDYYQNTVQYGCYAGQYCADQPVCRGRIMRCSFIDSDMWVCPSDYDSEKRRYQWIEYENGVTLGQKSGRCPNRVRKVDSWWRWLFWHCSYCFCICDEVSNWKSDRYFSLLPTFSKMEENKVLTGLQLVKINQVFYIKGQEGELMANGEVNATTLRWIRPTEVNINLQSPVSGDDYFKLTWEERSIGLDDLLAPPEHVLTGIQWRRRGSLLYLTIQACRWNSITGQLLRGDCKWISNPTTSYRSEVYLNSPTVPIAATVPSRIDSRSLQHVDFTHTDKYNDAAQSVVPYFDTQPVVPSPAVALVGAGIYHKGVGRSGGFIAPKIFTMDFSKEVKVDFKINE